ncbi:MAG: ArsR family transcriptional regulator [Desulfovibrionaceae bacterium]
MSFADLITEDRRLVILRLLKDASGYALNTIVLKAAVQSLGHKCSTDQVRSDAAWLEEQGLVGVERLEGVWVLTARRRGLDVAVGEAVVPGVKRPEPGE